MKRAAKMILLTAGGLLAFAVLALLLWRVFAQHRVAERIRIKSPNGIDSIEKVQLGGLEQWIQIRGWDRTKPLLLFLHGGPGFPQMPFAHLNAELERDFVVVQWDQRGAGKSYSWSIPDDSMRVAQFVADAHELVQLLLARFGVRKCYLVAHSWGSLFGAQLVAQHPELFFAYVGIGQTVDLPQTEHVLYQFALDSARRDHNQKAIGDLERIGPPPHSDANHKFMTKWVDYYSEREHPSLSRLWMTRLALESPAYSWIDLCKIPLGVRYSFAQLWKEIFYKTNLFKQAPRLEVPVYFLLGRHDRVVTWEVAERYFNALDAPRGKQLIWFEDSGHWPQFEESQKYRHTLVHRVLAETEEGSGQ
ncbi:MAG: alpha/beta fold hydrolase [Chthoniobacterales bacterium]